MELSEEHDGIIELDSGEVGQSFTDWLAANDPAKVDTVIEIAITPNRPDALGVRGIARDLAARGLGTMKARDTDAVPGTYPCPISVTIDDTDACPVFYGRVIRGVKNGPSPAWLQDALKAVGLRPISTLVDITNFFTYDRNRPLHVFDAAKVKGGLRVHLSKGSESFAALDDKEYTLEPGMTAISDDGGVESLGGIMGGLHSGCTEDTTDVFIEAAFFDPIRTAHTGRKLKINSDARYRFERGIDPEWTPVGLEHATRTADTQRASLTALGFTIDGDMAQVPSWRPDVQGEADLVEEVARIASLTKLQGRPLTRTNTGVPKPILTPMQKREQVARRTIAALGYNECVHYSFIDAASAAMFGGGDDASMLENPISSEMSHMRPALLPGLLQAAARNQARGTSNMALFEVGPAFHGGEPEEQHLLASGLIIGHTGPKDVHGTRRAVDVYDVKADAEAALSAMGAPAKVQILRGADAWWHPGRHGKICLGPKKVLGVFGELHPKVLSHYDIKGPAMAFTLYPAEIPFPKAKTATRAALTLQDLQAVERDFAFVVDAEVEALTLTNAAGGADKALIETVRVFDEFIGGSLGEGKKSLAITVRMQPRDKTLTDEEIEAVSAKIVEKVTKATGGTLRG